MTSGTKEHIFAKNLNLSPLQEFEKHKPFKKARLYDAKGDLKKRWYINFHVWSELDNRMVRRKDYDVNDYKTLAQRKAFAKKRIKEINKLLDSGYYIKIGVAEKEAVQEVKQEQMSTKEAFDYILELKKREVKHKSYLKIRQAVDGFLAFINLKKKTLPILITKKEVVAYSDYLVKDCNKSASTRNSYIFWIRHIFGLFLERGWVEENPAEGVKKMKELPSAKNKAYTREQQKNILELADPQLELSIMFFFYGFMRRNAIRLIKLQHINLKERQLFLPADTAKSGKGDYITLPPPLLEKLESLDLDTYPEDYYLFGKTDKEERRVIPSKIPFSVNVMYNRHRDILKQLDLDGKDYTLYSWKHSGVVAAYRAGIDIKSIQFQCCHHSLEMTDRYLKSLGLFRDKDVFGLMPRL